MLLGFCIFCLCHIFGQIWFLFVQVCLCWIYYGALCVFMFGSLLGLCKCIYCVSLSICLNLSFAMSMPAILLGLWGYLCGPPLFMFICVHYVQMCLSLFNVHCLCMLIATKFDKSWIFLERFTWQWTKTYYIFSWIRNWSVE